MRPQAAFWATATLAIETLIAALLILGLGRRPLYVFGALFSFLLWSVPESFGHVWILGQTDPGTSIIYVFVYMSLLWLDRGSAGGGLSLDRWLEPHWRQWRCIAELQPCLF